MTKQTRRSSPRDCRESPIFVANKSSGDYSSAVMYNSSCDGMYFETSCHIQDGQEVYVKVENKESKVSKEDICRQYLAKVKWCRNISTEENKPYFGFGICFTPENKAAFEAFVTGFSINCDKCGIMVHASKACKSANSLNLCRHCHEQLTTYPEGELKSCIENYLMGNVF